MWAFIWQATHLLTVCMPVLVIISFQPPIPFCLATRELGVTEILLKELQNHKLFVHLFTEVEVRI